MLPEFHYFVLWGGYAHCSAARLCHQGVPTAHILLRELHDAANSSLFTTPQMKVRMSNKPERCEHNTTI